MRLFDYLPANFFNVFAGESRRQYADVLFIIYKMMSGTSFMASRDSVVIALSDYFDTLEGETFDAVEARTSRDKAATCLRRLKECGWIKEETGKHYETTLSFEDYATTVLETLIALPKTDTIEYGGYVHTIHTLVTTLQDETADLSIEQIHQNTVKLMNSLKSLNANIKKYIERLIRRQQDENIESLLETLLVDYQEKVVNRAYQNLKTIDNPNRYKNTIVNRLDNLLHDDETLKRYSASFATRKNVTESVAEETLYDMLTEVIDAFDQLDVVMEEIDFKHARYLSVAVARITYLYQNRGDLEAKVHRLIHTLAKQDTATFDSDPHLFNLEALFNLDPQSLYKKPIKSTFTPSSLTERMTDRAAILEEAAALMRESAFSVTAINAYVDTMLGTALDKKASALPLETTLDYIRVILIDLYGTDDQATYTIARGSEPVKKARRHFTDFLIIRKEPAHEPLQ